MKKHEFSGLIVLFLALALVMASCDNNGGNSSSDTKYTITYHPNGVAVTVPEPQKATAGSTVYVAALEEYVPATPTAPILSGWNTEADGSGDSYDRGASLVVDKDITLYAQWAEYIDRPRENTITLEKAADYWYSGLYYLDSEIDERPVWGDTYKMTFKLKSEKYINTGLAVVLGDAFQGEWLTLAAPDVLDDTQNRESMKPIYTDTDNSYTLIATALGPDDLRGRMGKINSVNFVMNINEAPTLTILEFNVEKIGSVEEITLLNVTANGSIETKTSQLTLTFDKPVNFLRDAYAQYNIRYDLLTSEEVVGNPIYLENISKNDVDGKIWNVTISNNIRIKDGAYTKGIESPIVVMNVYVKEAGFSGTKLVTLYTGYTPVVPPRPSNFVSLTADGGSTSTTTKLTLTFTEKIVDLRANDITLSGVSVSAGFLSAAQSGNNWVYTLPISSFTKGGLLRVFVSKDGWDISNSAQTVTIYYYRPTVPPINYPPYEGFIGRGYDMLNKPYYDKREVTTAYALNMPKLVYDGKLRKDTNLSGESETEYFAGQTLQEYAQNFSNNTKVGVNVGLFSASAGFGYSTGSQVTNTSSFAKSSTHIVKERHYIDMGAVSLETIQKNYLNDVFKRDWLMKTEVTPAELFENFGTHIFLVANMGGRLDMDFEMNNTERWDTTKITAEIKASYSYVSVKNTTEMTDTMKKVERNEKFHAIAFGGDYDNTNFSTFDHAKASYQSWVNSVQKTNNLSLVRGGNIKRKTEMVPIWELIDTSAAGKEGVAALKRKEELEAAFNKMLANNKGMIMGLQQPCKVADVFMGWGNSPEAAEANLLSNAEAKAVIVINKGDLNKGSGNNSYLFLGYSLTASDSEAAVTDIKAYFTTSKTEPPTTKTFNGRTYTKFGYDANKGMGGDFIWLYYTKDKNAGKPLQDIVVEYNGKIQDQTVNEYIKGGGWVRVKWENGTDDADMNKGTGKTPVYVWMQRKTD